MDEPQFKYDKLLAAYPEPVRERVEKFVAFAALLNIEIEDFQRLIMSEVFSGRTEILVLLPRKNGKTTLIALLCLWHMLTTNEPWVIVAAANYKQATTLLNEAKKLAQRHPAVESKFEFPFDHLKLKGRAGKLEVIAADKGGSKHGSIPTLCVADEAHAHKDSQTYTALKTSLSRATDQIVVISTAGLNKKSFLYAMRKKALKLPNVFKQGTLTYTSGEVANFSMLEWALPQDCDLARLTGKRLKTANPLSHRTVKFFDEQLAAPGMTREEVAAFHGNVWATAASSWLPPGAWDKCFEKGATIPKGVKVVLGVDIGIKYDSSAVVILWKRDDGKVVVKAHVFEPQGDGTALDLGIIEQFIRRLREDYTVEAVHYDQAHFDRSAQDLSDEGLVMAAFPQNNARLVPATQALYEAINEQKIVHDGDLVLASHVIAAAPAYRENGFRLSKHRSEEKIDACMAMMFGFSGIELPVVKPSVYQSEDLLVL